MSFQNVSSADRHPRRRVKVLDTDISCVDTWLSKRKLPKLFIAAEPGAVLVGRAREICRTWPNQQEISVTGIHSVQEDSPAEIGNALQAFVNRA